MMLMGIMNISAIFSQVSSLGNFWGPNRYLGWNNTNGINPLLFKTNATNRMKLNGNSNYGIDGYFAPRNGYFLLSPTTTTSAQYLYNQKGAFSMLHLNGSQGTFPQEGGYRPWMRTGITLTDNNDLSYMGIRKVGSGTDITETTITWSDNQGNNPPGPDDMTFRFTGSGK